MENDFCLFLLCPTQTFIIVDPFQLLNPWCSLTYGHESILYYCNDHDGHIYILTVSYYYDHACIIQALDQQTALLAFSQAIMTHSQAFANCHVNISIRLQPLPTFINLV